MEDLFESIIGAVYVDCGMDMQRVVSVVCGMLDINLYFSQDAAPIQSYKNALQEWCADKKHRLPAPIYRTFSVSGPDHKRVYEREVLIGDRVVAVGKGKNQKLADAAAAEAALRILTEEDKGESVVNLQYLTELKKYAAKNKNPSPEFRDLGETPNSTPSDREYIIECRCMGKCESAVGKSKQEARALAAEKVLSALTQKQSPIKESLKKKPAAKKQSEKIKTNSVSFEDGGKKLPGGKRENKVKKVSRDGNRKNRSSSPKKQSYQHKKHL
jgi:dsRNA-specific ribonuclease